MDHVDAACTAEVLDGRDNDCNGLVDDGFWTTVFTTPHSVLSARDSACDGQTAIEANPYACQLAARRECQARGYAAGFRPVEVNATLVAFGCVADVEFVSAVTYPTLSAQVPECSSATEAFRGACFTAIKRFCAARGFVVGIGPLNDDVSTSIDLVCTNHAAFARLTFNELRTADAKCDLPTGANAWDFPCFRAYHRSCLAHGFVSAWGPIELNSTSQYVDIACLPAKL